MIRGVPGALATPPEERNRTYGSRGPDRQRSRLRGYDRQADGLRGRECLLQLVEKIDVGLNGNRVRKRTGEGLRHFTIACACVNEDVACRQSIDHRLALRF